ncbi:MAG TPA: choice-of-anchor J domain-containing protein, partial [Tenuifilaceae bacterium]|nr:choice-of-anchor J domain-containing protein [Tenuifilaceae bacterium]
WYLNVRADLRDDYVMDTWGTFEILGVNLTATLDLDDSGDQFELDNVTYLFPGSLVNIDYALGAGETINTNNLDVQIVLEYSENAGADWMELKTQDFSAAPDQFIEANLPDDITAANIDFRLRLVYGDNVDLGTVYIDRDNDSYGGNVDQLPIEIPVGTANAGDLIGFHIFASNNTAQSLVVEFMSDEHPVWTVLGTVNTLATDNKYVLNYTDEDDNFSIVPDGELLIENAMARVRWADGLPLGENRAIYRGLRYQVPYVLNVQSNEQSVGILYPHLTLSDDVAIQYVYPDTLSNVAVTINYEMQYIPTTTQVAAVLVKNGESPLTHPYIYLGSAAAVLNNFGTQTFNIDYTDIQEFIGGHLPNLPNIGDLFDVYLYLTDKVATDPIMFKTEEIIVDWKENYDAQPMMITDFIDLTGLNTPTYLTYDWIEITTPDPLNDYTTPVMEFSLDSGTTWTEFDTYPFTTEIELTGDILTSKTQFRWRQPISMGEWDVQNVKIKSGEDNLVNYIYYKTGIPQTIAMVLPEVETPPVVDPCEDFNKASLLGYEFIPSDTTVNVGEDVEFEWNFLRNSSKAIVDSSLVADKVYVHGANDMGFTLKFESDKKITQFTMTFPTGVTPTAADVINVDGNTLNPVITAATRLITWTSAAGVVIGTQDIDFNVEFTVATTVNDTIDVAWTLTDADGAVNGTCEIYPAIEFPEGTEFYFYIPTPIAKGDSKYIQDVDVSSSNLNYITGVQTLNFNVYAADPDDDEWIWEVQFDFPDWVTIVSASDIPTNIGFADDMTPTIVGQNITWGDGYNWQALSLGAGANFSFTVDVNIADYNGDIDIDWLVRGDWGNDVNGILTIADFPATLINSGGLPITMDMENFYFQIPEDIPTGAYNIYAQAISNYEEGKGQCKNNKTLVFEDIFVMNDQTPEVYEIDLTEVNYLDPSDDYYWAENVEVKFNTFGPWQDFEDLRYEAVLTQYGILDPVATFTEDFEGGIPAGWNNTGAGALWDWTEGVAIHWDDSGAQDDWLITPQISLPEGTNTLNFWNYGYYPTFYVKNSILVSAGSPNPVDGDFVEIWSPATITAGWVNEDIDLTAYSGQDVYIAFRYEGNWSHYWGVDDVTILSGMYGNTDFYHLGNVPHVEGENIFVNNFALPAFDDLEGKNFDLDIDGTDFVVEIRAFQGEEGDQFIPAILVENIDEFFLLGGTDDEVTPLTFDIEDVLRYAITNKLPIDGYEGQDVYLQFTYSANITAPNFLTLPRLQVTMDNGVTYTDIAIPGSTFESQKRLDATAAGLVYRYKIADEYLTNDTRFRWYQEVPDGVWSIDEISITRLTNEVPLAGYLINDPYHIVVKEPAAPASPCDAFSPATLAAYDWAVDSIDTNTGFEAPVIAGEEFEYNFSWNEVLGIDLGLEQYPDSTEFLFYAKKKDSNFKKA